MPQTVEVPLRVLVTVEHDTPVTKSFEPDSELAAINVLKASDERQYTLGLGYPAMRLDRSVAADNHRDFVSAEALEKTAWRWMAENRSVNLLHKSGTTGHATVVESYIFRAGDWWIKDGQTIPTGDPENVPPAVTVIKSGDWLVGCVWDDAGWRLVKERKVNGWSPEGGAKRAIPTAARLAELRS